MTEDISDMLEAWPYDPTEHIRKIVGDDGREKLQIRISQGGWSGVLQMELHGRPDNKRPHDREFALDYFRELLAKHREQHESDEGFSLNHKNCEELFEESFNIYNRYVVLLTLRDYDRVIRDTERNMEAFRFINRHAVERDDRMALERWWPYILRINGTARAMMTADNGDLEQALVIVRETRREIEDLTEVDAQEFHLERERSREGLLELEESIRQGRGKSRRETLQKQMENAVAQEEFEIAAKLRDQIENLREE